MLVGYNENKGMRGGYKPKTHGFYVLSIMDTGARLDPRWSSPTALYRYFEGDGTLLYVGISNQPLERNRVHAMRADWFGLSRWRSVEWFPTRALAEWAENRAIAREEPEFNAKRLADGPFERLSDMWFLEGQGEGYDGQHKGWLFWPEGHWQMRGDVFSPSEPPDWA